MQPMWKKTSCLAAAAMAATLLLLFAGSIAFGMLPFGTADFVVNDARIQYIDFFAWLQRVLHGEDSVTWSFYRGLGGNAWPLFTYYLSSPWNAAVLLFRPQDLYLFYDLLVGWKLSLASACMAVYLSLRFGGRIPAWAALLLSVACGMSAYGLETARNVMWLDGFYMLPLILLGVWRAGTRQGSACLVASSACAMIFNWYSGCIDLLFAGFFALWEGWLFCGDAFRLRSFLAFLGRALRGMLLGVGLSACFFVPTLSGLVGGRAGIDWEAFSFRYVGSLSSLLASQTWGSFSTAGHASLYIGAFAFLGAGSFFLNGEIPRKWRIRALLLLGFIALMFYWQPLFFLFSLLKGVQGYWYRYSSAAIFLLIYLAGWNASAGAGMAAFHKRAACLALGLPALVAAACYVHQGKDIHLVLASLSLCVVLAGLVFLSCHFHGRRRTLLLAAVIAASLCDLFGNFGAFVSGGYRDGASARYASYEEAQAGQLASLSARDAGGVPGRISQTTTFNMDSLRWMANYNEGMAYGVRTISSYTSAAVNGQMAFLDRFGYRQSGPNMNITNTSVLGTDALLGVRYVLSDRPLQGLRRLGGIPEANGKAAYENPFAWPLAFVCSSTDLSGLTEEDPFLHTNAAYARLFGQPMDVYVPVPFEVVEQGGNRWRCNVPASSDGQLYGDIESGDPARTMWDLSLVLTLDGARDTFTG